MKKYYRCLVNAPFLPIAWPLLLLFCLGVNSFSWATTRYVKAGSSGSGSSWTDASGSLQDMINASISGDQVWVAAGTYKPTTTTDRGMTFSLVNGVAIYGGFSGEETLLSSRNTTANPTILSGDIGTIGEPTDNSNHLFDLDNITDVRLDGFTFRDSYDQISDGCFRINNSSLIIANCLFTDNAAYNYGHLRATTSTIKLTNCIFTNTGGASVINQSGSFELSNCTFHDISGIGVFTQGTGTSTLTNCLFHDVYTPAVRGGCVAMSGTASTTLTNCTLTNNGGYLDPVMYVSAGTTITITNCIFWNNQGVAGIGNGGGNITITYSDIQGGYPGTGNINADPLFISATNFRLQPCSPPANTGSNDAIAGTTIDLDGNPRTFGSTVDMGVYERQIPKGSITVTLTTPPKSNITPGQSATLTASGATTYNWSTGNTESAINVTPANTTTYSVTGLTGSCLATATVTLCVISVSIAATPSLTVTQGGTVALTASGANAYLWGNNAERASLPVTTSGTYSVSGMTAGGCIASASVAVTVNPVPVIPLTVSNIQAAELAPGTCPIRILVLGSGRRFEITGPGAYYFNVPFRDPVTNILFVVSGVKLAGTYTFKSYGDVGQAPVVTTIQVKGTGCP